MVYIREIKLVIDNKAVEKYTAYYFKNHPRAYRPPIQHPYHESINKWMIMKRPMMNALKQKWKNFMVWFIEDQGYTNLHIEQCDILFKTYYDSNRKHDPDNSTPKFILDGLCLSGFITDDSGSVINELALRCYSDIENPRTEIIVKVR